MIYKYANCKKLKETTFPNPKSVRIINNGEMTSTFNELLNDYINPYNCHYITGFLYNLAKEITEESHEETATSIGDSAFSGCSNLWDARRKRCLCARPWPAHRFLSWRPVCSR